MYYPNYQLILPLTNLSIVYELGQCRKTSSNVLPELSVNSTIDKSIVYRLGQCRKTSRRNLSAGVVSSSLNFRAFSDETTLVNFKIPVKIKLCKNKLLQIQNFINVNNLTVAKTRKHILVSDIYCMQIFPTAAIIDLTFLSFL